jgi:hypothetical protein
MRYHAIEEGAGKVWTLDLFPDRHARSQGRMVGLVLKREPDRLQRRINKLFVPIDVLLLKRVSKRLDFNTINPSLALYF